MGVARHGWKQSLPLVVLLTASLFLSEAQFAVARTGACNYDETATSEDGSCEYESCALVARTTRLATTTLRAIIDDGSCCFDNCVSINMSDSFGDGWNGAIYTLTDCERN